MAFGAKWNAKKYETVKPTKELGSPFRNLATALNFTSWPDITMLFPGYYSAVQTKQDNLVVDIDKQELETRIDDYFNASIDNQHLTSKYPLALRGSYTCDPIPARAYFISRGISEDALRPFAFHPFDSRWIYWESDKRIIGSPSPDYATQVFPGNITFASAQHNRKGFDPPIVTRILACMHLIERSANIFPLFLREAGKKVYSAMNMI